MRSGSLRERVFERLIGPARYRTECPIEFATLRILECGWQPQVFVVVTVSDIDAAPPHTGTFIHVEPAGRVFPAAHLRGVGSSWTRLTACSPGRTAEVHMQLADMPRPIAYVLGGGGSLGAIQVGMLQALSELGVVPDLVAGTSVGSLNGAVVASDPKGAANRLSHVWARVRSHDVFPGNLLAQVHTLRRSKTYLFPNSGLSALITDFIGAATTFADLALPFAAITVDIATARPHPIREGELLPALLASAAIPGIFPAVEHDGLRLYDGGLVANVPIRQAVAMGARSVVVLDCNFPGQMPDAPANFADVLMFTMMVTMRSQTAIETPAVAAAVPVVYLPGPTPRQISPLDFGHTATLIEASYEAARSFLDHLDITGPGLYGSPSV